MKRKFSKILGVGLTIALLVSLLLTAAPVMAAALTVDTSIPASATNFLTIQAAVNAAGPGDTIIVAAGTYPENVVLPSGLNITLLGAQADVDPTAGRAGPESVLDGWVGNLHGTGNGITLPSDAGIVVINGFTIQGYEYGIKGTESGGVVGATISYNILDGNGNDGNAPNYSDDLNNEGAGIRVYNMDASTISYNVVKNGERGIRLDDASGSGSDGNTVSHNLIHDNEQYGIAIYTGGNNNLIEYNTIYNSGDRGIQLGWGEDHSGNVIQYNVIHDVNNDGILITRATNFIVRGNTIYNVAFTNQTLGRPTGGNPDNYTFSTQAVHGGIALVGTNSNVTITGNVLHNNGEMGEGNPWGTINGATTTTATSDGIWLSSGSTGITVRQNSIYNNNEYGLENENTGAITDAILNWWGSADGPFGLGANPVSDNVDYDPWYDSLIVFTTDGSTTLNATYTATPPPRIEISVTELVSFGAVAPGVPSEPEMVTIINTGEVDVDLSAEITTESHPPVYTDGLVIDTFLVIDWSASNVAPEETVDATLILTVPTGTAPDFYTATLVFWAEATQ